MITKLTSFSQVSTLKINKLNLHELNSGINLLLAVIIFSEAEKL